MVTRLRTCYTVQRFDNNPLNTHTFGTWVHVSSFDKPEAAQAYVERASGPTQYLRVKREEIYRSW